MPISMQWNEAMEVNVGEIDEQHKKLISIIKSLYDTFQSDKAVEEEKEILVELIKYTDYHFSKERELMLKYSYPERDEHLELHKEFTGKLKDFCQKHQVEKSAVSRDVLNFLIKWIINHIMNRDMKFGAFLNQRGVK
ncbi:MAG: bacteriohemerythrin [Deltaproteobacteria bacterium]|nr:bacteriohemerythrin [Deltaproteobacteria bacterium]